MSRVLFVQLPPPRFTFEEAPSNVPLAGGFLASMLRSDKENRIEGAILDSSVVDIYADTGVLRAIVDCSPDVLALSLYVWNVQRSLFLAARYKRLNPDARVIVGGPEVTPDNAWVLRHPGVDAGVFGEGETRVEALISSLMSGLPDVLPATFVKHQGEIIANTLTVSPLDPAACVYPYLTGTIGPTRDGTLFLETVRGCPFRCRYCYYHKAFEGVRPHSRESIRSLLEWAYGTDSRVREIYLMDPSFNAGREYRDLLRIMAKLRERRDVKLHTELRADLLRGEDVRLMRDAGLASAEVGLQTITESALAQAGRSMNLERFQRGVKLLKDAEINVTTGIIVGLPGDSPDGVAATLRWLQDREAYSVVHPFVLSVLPGTEFRASAGKLGLDFLSRPPYYVRSTRAFSPATVRESLRASEEAFDMELDAIPFPSLVDSGIPAMDVVPEEGYVSKWIVDPRTRSDWRQVLAGLVRVASDPFTIWFRSPDASKIRGAAVEIVRTFLGENPHALVRVVFESDSVPDSSLFLSILEETAQPDLFVNRSYEPLLGSDSVVTPDFTVLVPHYVGLEGSLSDDDSGPDQVRYVHQSIGDMSKIDVPDRGPILVSLRTDAERLGRSDIKRLFRGFPEHRSDEIMFRDYALQRAWSRDRLGVSVDYAFEERILRSLGPA